MNDTTLARIEDLSPKTGPLVDLTRRAVLRRLDGLAGGTLVLRENGRCWRFGDGPELRVDVLTPAFWSAVALRGSVGAGESYMDGLWRCDDLVGLMRLLLRNRAVLARVEGGLARLSAPLRGLFHQMNRNSRSGSRRNIAAHYDLGNDFYRLWLDETMMYSCALFERPGMSLAEASTAKLERICRRLDLRPDDEVLEIGTGWGGFALHAAGRFGCRVTTATISAQQYELARERVRAAGLEDRVRVVLED
jgi:cyclopropane-fatty-acyl-phospholipid synthase